MEASPRNSDKSSSVEDSTNQATDLPEHLDIELFNHLGRLEEPNDFPLWLRNTTRLLNSAGLDKLINIHIPRPEAENEKYKRWLNYSKLLQHYLSESISDEILNDIVSPGKPLKLADEFMHEAKKALEAEGIYADLEGVSTLSSIRIAGHDTIEDFVWDFKKNFQHLWDLKVPVNPYFAMCMLLNKLDRTETRFIFASTIADLHKRAAKIDLWSGFTEKDFHVVCTNIAHRLEVDMREPNERHPLTLLPANRFKALLEKTVTKDMDVPADDIQIKNTDLKASETPVKTSDSATYEAMANIEEIHPSEMDLDQPTARELNFGTPDRKWFPAPGTNKHLHAQRLRERLGSVELPNKVCAYCNQRFHTAARCFYLNPATRPLHWKPDPSLWCYMHGSSGLTSIGRTPMKENGQYTLRTKRTHAIPVRSPSESPTETRKEEAEPVKEVEKKPKAPLLIGSPFDTVNKFTASNRDWIILRGPGKHICANKAVMTEYQDYGPEDTPHEWMGNPAGNKDLARASGRGKAKISLLGDDRNLIHNIFIDCHYNINSRFNVFFIEEAEKELMIKYVKATGALHDEEDGMKILGYVVHENGVPFLRTLDSTIEINLMDLFE
ncbi:hypothetical protein N7454_009679 [Penicillium verhagenii]|nr:hypothetical protein N7454_009679 [Penicillium verhagenii]